jgi:hypothetical protein
MRAAIRRRHGNSHRRRSARLFSIILIGNIDLAGTTGHAGAMAPHHSIKRRYVDLLLVAYVDLLLVASAV